MWGVWGRVWRGCGEMRRGCGDVVGVCWGMYGGVLGLMGVSKQHLSIYPPYSERKKVPICALRLRVRVTVVRRCWLGEKVLST